MAGENNFNAAKIPATVFDKDGNVHTTTRPNARELVMSGDYFWKAEDAGKERTEDAGPEDPTADVIAVYDKDGNPHEVSRANARDMVNSGDYTWAPAHADEDEDEADADSEGGDEESSEEAPKTEETVETKEPVAEDPLDPVNASLAEIAERVTGNSDVAAYLEGFSEDNLREMAVQRYGEKMHHKASKATIIAKMVELEEAKLDAEDSGDSEEG